MVVIVDYDAGNVMSVLRACEAVGTKAQLSKDPDLISHASHVILPGQGAFGDAMYHMSEYGIIEPVCDVINSGVPFLGICLGLQVLYQDSEESPGTKGLGILAGHILHIPDGVGVDGRKLHIPHICWSSVELPRTGRLFSGIEGTPFFYFDHSYYLKAADDSTVTAVCDYGTQMDVSIERDNVFACQFHPEKSSDTGLKVLKNFLNL